MGLLVPTGTVGVFDYHEQLAALDEEQRQRLRAVILSHNNDPIVVHGTDRADVRPLELERAERTKAEHGQAAPPPPAHRATALLPGRGTVTEGKHVVHPQPMPAKPAPCIPPCG